MAAVSNQPHRPKHAGASATPAAGAKRRPTRISKDGFAAKVDAPSGCLALPTALLSQATICFDAAEHDLYSSVVQMLARQCALLGCFPPPAAAPPLRGSAGEEGDGVGSSSSSLAVPPGHTPFSLIPPQPRPPGGAAAFTAARAHARDGGVPPGHTAFSWHAPRTAATDALPPPPPPPPRLECFRLHRPPPLSPEHQALLSRAVERDERFLAAYERLVLEVVLPAVKARLDAAAAGAAAAPAATATPASATRFFYQFPPTIRLQPGPSQKEVRAHSDSAYGHQQGELNCWLPLTPPALTRTTLWLESAAGAGDFAPLDVEPGAIGVFHGTCVRHCVPANPSCYCRVSLDFRVGLGGAVDLGGEVVEGTSCYDPTWEFMGHSMAHVRRYCDVAARLPPPHHLSRHRNSSE
jgi:hypothetical protein